MATHAAAAGVPTCRARGAGRRSSKPLRNPGPASAISNDVPPDDHCPDLSSPPGLVKYTWLISDAEGFVNPPISVVFWDGYPASAQLRRHLAHQRAQRRDRVDVEEADDE